jgi:hypothetical protein
MVVTQSKSVSSRLDFGTPGDHTMTSPHDVYNTVIDLMCRHCNKSIFRQCGLLDEDTRCKTKIKCMKDILKRDDEMYPIELPKV